MITELQKLQNLVVQLNHKHQKNLQELQELRTKPTIDPEILIELQDEHKLLRNNFTDLQNKFDDLSYEMNQIVDEHQDKSAECLILTEKVSQLATEKSELLAKNEISSQRAHNILERLASLDKNI